jgi:hypothetical protein
MKMGGTENYIKKVIYWYEQSAKQGNQSCSK